MDDHALLRTGVANIINQEPGLRVVAEAGNGVEAIEAYERHHPDVTLLDLRMPVMEGVEVVRRIRERDPAARVIVLTTYDTDDEISRALKAGAKAYVLKDISADGLVNCIRDVLAGKTYLAPAAAAKLAEGVTRVQLTPREMATLRLLADGKANKEIANALRHQRAHRQDAPGASVREAGRDEPHRGHQGRDAPGPGPARLSTAPRLLNGHDEAAAQGGRDRVGRRGRPHAGEQGPQPHVHFGFGNAEAAGHVARVRSIRQQFQRGSLPGRDVQHDFPPCLIRRRGCSRFDASSCELP